MKIFENYINRLKSAIYRYSIIFGVAFFAFLILVVLYLSTSLERKQFQYIVSAYQEIKDIKNQKNLSLDSMSGFDNLDKSLKKLSKYSTGKSFSLSFNKKLNTFLSNLYLLNNDFQRSKKLIDGNKWDYYFNLGNINLFQGYSLFTGKNNKNLYSSYKHLNRSIKKYDISLKLLGSGDVNKRNKILNNKSVANELKFAVGVKFCISMYKDALQKIRNVNKKISKLLNIFKKESNKIPHFKKQLQDDNLKKCLSQFEKSLKSSRSNTTTFKNLIGTYQNRVKSLISSSLEKPNYCIQNKEEFQENITSSTKQISKSLDNYIQLHSVILKAIEQKNKGALEKLCENSKNFSKKTSKFSKQLNEGIKKLKKTLGKAEKKKKQKNDEKTKNSNNKKHDDIPKEQEEKLKKDIKNKSNNWIKQMNKMKGEKGYDPRNYLDKLFDQFYGNDKGFQQKGGPTPNEKSW